MLSNPLLRNLSWAMTEPLYIVLMLTGILIMMAYLGTHQRRWLVLAAVSASLALLTRYVGFSLVGAFLLVLLLDRSTPIRRRLSDVAILLSITLVPILAWLVRNWLVSDSLTNRILAWHPISAENVSFLIKAVNSWGLIPQRLLAGSDVLALGLLLLLAAGSLFWLWRTLPRPGKSPASEFMLLLAGWLYVLLLITSLFSLDATTRLENRILLPFYVLILLLIILGLAGLWQHKTLLARIPALLICLWLVYFSVTRVDGAIADLRLDGQGYASLRWQSSPTAGYLRQQDPSLVYTNDVTAIYFLAGEDSVGIPNASATEADLDRMRLNLERPGSFLVIFGTLTGEFAPFEQLTRDLTLVAEFEDGQVFQNP